MMARPTTARSPISKIVAAAGLIERMWPRPSSAITPTVTERINCSKRPSASSGSAGCSGGGAAPARRCARARRHPADDAAHQRGHDREDAGVDRGHALNMYPRLRIVMMWRGLLGSISIFSRSQRTWTLIV